MRRFLKNLFAFLLGHTAQHREFFSLRLKFFVVVQEMEDFLFGLVADGAGIVKNQVGLFDCLDLGITLLDKSANDFFRVMDIHLTTESLNVERFLLRLSHSVKYIAVEAIGALG